MINTKGVKPAKFESVEDAPAWCALACAYIVAGHAAPEKAADAMLAEFRTRAGRSTVDEDGEPEAKTEEAPAPPAKAEEKSAEESAPPADAWTEKT
jgi:hypothetical protein